MQLLILLVIAGVIGYLLSDSRYSQRIDQTAESIAEKSSNLVGRAQAWWRDRFSKRTTKKSFIQWATGDGANHFPEEFCNWLTSLQPEGANRFTSALTAYARGLNYHIDDLTTGKLDNKPAFMQVFVEAVVVYSREYRKALEAQSEHKTREEKKSDTSSNDGKAVAEKQPSRRKGTVGDSPEPSATD